VSWKCYIQYQKTIAVFEKRLWDNTLSFLLKLAHFEHLAISESIHVQSWIWLLVHVQEELLHLLTLFFTWNTMALLLTFNSSVLNYIYFTQVTHPSWILQDKNLTSIYFAQPEKGLNYKLCLSLILSNLKNSLWIFIPTGKLVQFLLVAEIESIACSCWGIPSLVQIYRSLNWSRFKIVFEYFSMFRMNCCIY
jgi:hypothetical protein